MIFSCFHRYICVEGVVRCHNNIILGHFIKLLHILVLHLEYLDIILNLLKCSRNQKPCCSVLLHVCGNGYILPCDLCNRVYMKLQISSIRSLELSKQPPGILFWLLVFFFFYTLVIPLSIPKPADPSSLLLFLKLLLQRFTLWECGWLQILQFWQGFNWGNSHRYIFKNERADCTQAMIFMLTEIL